MLTFTLFAEKAVRGRSRTVFGSKKAPKKLPKVVRHGAESPLFSVPFSTPFFNRFWLPLGPFLAPFWCPGAPPKHLFSATFPGPAFVQSLEGPRSPFLSIFGAIFDPGAHFFVPFSSLFRLFFPRTPSRLPTRSTHQDTPTKAEPRPALSAFPEHTLRLPPPCPSSKAPTNGSYIKSHTPFLGRAVLPLCGLNPPAPLAGAGRVKPTLAVPKPYHQNPYKSAFCFSKAARAGLPPAAAEPLLGRFFAPFSRSVF